MTCRRILIACVVGAIDQSLAIHAFSMPLILPDLSLDDTVRSAERLRPAIETDLRVLCTGHQHSVTMSAGVAAVSSGLPGDIGVRPA